MNLKQLLAIAGLATLPFAATAQQAPQQPNPLDANATVPASAYQSAFKNYQAATDETESPEQAWRAANDEMAKLRGHTGHIKDKAPASSAPAQAAPMDHSKHHGL